MSQSVITSAFVEWKAQQAVDNKPVVLDEFVLAFIPDLDITNPIDPGEGLPPASQIVHRQAVGKSGVLNQNAVVYSMVMGADVGDFDFNWIGIINKASGVVATIIHALTQRKVKNNSGQQGNVLTRSILMEYNGARSETQIEVPAETWQIDFTARLAGMDERQRVENVDIYGPGAFFGNGFLVTKTGTAYSIAAGVGYVGGLRAQLAAATVVAVTNKPVRLWVDVVWKGTLTSVWGVECVVTVAANLADYVKDGQQHYVFAVASIDGAGNVTDLRPKGSLADQGGASAYARKDMNLSDLDSIPKAREALKLKGASLLDVGTAAGTVAAGDDSRIVNAVPKTRKINGHQLNGDFDITAGDVKALAVTTLRAQLTPRAGEVGDANFLPPNSVSFVYYNAPNGPGITGSLLDFSGADGEYNTQIAAAYNGSGDAIRFRTRNGDNKTWNPWFAFYHSGNKPTAADVSALPLAGGAMSGEITGAYTQSLAFADQYSTRAPFYDDFVSPAYSAYRPLIKQRVQTTNNAWAFSQGTLLDNGNLSWYLHMHGSSGIAVFHKWATDGNYYAPRQVVPGDYSNFDKRYFIRGGYADFDNRYFTKGETAAYFSPLVQGYAAVGSYIMAISYTGNIGPGGNVAGSSLRASTADGMAGGGELPGTWRCMGNMSTVNDAHRTSLWLRIS